MRNTLFFSGVLLAAGLILSGTAVFANTLGLDQEAGWGRARIGLLLFGVLVILCAVLYYKYASQIHFAALKIKNFLTDLPVWSFTFPIIVGVIIIYAWFGSSGRWTLWKSHTYYYDNLAHSFLNGKLHLSMEPDPKLLELSNPYKKSERVKAGTGSPVDVSLYKEKFYLYWGPAPALLLAVIYPFFDGEIGDVVLAFAFVCGIFLIQTFLLHIIWRYYFSNLPGWILHLSIFVVGLVGPLILLRHAHGSARIYEASIAGAQFFFMGGFLAVLLALNKPAISGWNLAAAGTLWALAIGSRQTAAVPIGIMGLLLLWRIFKTKVLLSKKITQAASLGIPIFLGFLSLGWYNWARFGSFTETGLYYQLTGWDIQAHFDDLFSPIYSLQNIYNYLFNPVIYDSTFPYVFMRRGTEIPIFSFYSVPNMYSAEMQAGALYIFPFLIFSVIPLFILLKKDHIRNLMAVDFQKNLDLIILGLSGSFVASFGLLTMFFWVGMRYTGDFMPSLTMLSIIGFWQGYQHVSKKPWIGKIYTIFGVLLAVISILLGVLLVLSTDTGLVKKLI